ncbi:DUF427 domain-containing protein [Streptomyces crystallinus]|uniref:DUF427 domain-containing protein n=1 Tax=Streptomyces crystallinus TaxID=68191 RepID=A0ABN1F3R6_9ACTN
MTTTQMTYTILAEPTGAATPPPGPPPPYDPEHRVSAEAAGEDALRVRVLWEGQVLADSTRPLLVHEDGLPVRYYLPPEDVRLDLLSPSDTRTTCPYKGVAAYWSLPEAPDIAWAYHEPLAAVALIKDHLCFIGPAADPA